MPSYLMALEIEKASLFHAAREQKNYSKVNAGLKINNKVVTDKDIIETKVIKFFNALFNGHHRNDLEDKGVPFVHDWSGLDLFLDNLEKM